MINSTYLSYIKSAEWAEKSEARKALDGKRCQMCGRKDHLHVHHKNYKHFKHESIENDLITLCESCHKLVHQQKDEFILGVVHAFILLEALNKYGSGVAILKPFGITDEKLCKYWEKFVYSKLTIVYIPISDDEPGAITVPFITDSPCEEDMRKISGLINVDYDYEIHYGIAHELYDIAAEHGAFIKGDSRKEGVTL